jgi:hypothetical protein
MMELNTEENMPQTSENLIKANKRGGIIFFKTKILQELYMFYINEIGCQLWLDQGSCQIFQFSNMLVGFCVGDETEIDGTITFFYESRELVDDMYSKLKRNASFPPRYNYQFNIYQFFAKDPEGRTIEFQCFEGL